MSSETSDQGGPADRHSTVRALGEAAFFRAVVESVSAPLVVLDAASDGLTLAVDDAALAAL